MRNLFCFCLEPILVWLGTDFGSVCFVSFWMGWVGCDLAWFDSICNRFSVLFGSVWTGFCSIRFGFPRNSVFTLVFNTKWTEPNRTLLLFFCRGPTRTDPSAPRQGRNMSGRPLRKWVEYTNNICNICISNTADFLSLGRRALLCCEPKVEYPQTYANRMRQSISYQFTVILVT